MSLGKFQKDLRLRQGLPLIASMSMMDRRGHRKGREPVNLERPTDVCFDIDNGFSRTWPMSATCRQGLTQRGRESNSVAFAAGNICAKRRAAWQEGFQATRTRNGME